MTFHTHARCDRCEAILHVDNEEQLLEEGWLTVNTGDDDGPKDFCSPKCVKQWAATAERTKKD